VVPAAAGIALLLVPLLSASAAARRDYFGSVELDDLAQRYWEGDFRKHADALFALVILEDDERERCEIAAKLSDVLWWMNLKAPDTIEDDVIEKLSALLDRDTLFERSKCISYVVADILADMGPAHARLCLRLSVRYALRKWTGRGEWLLVNQWLIGGSIAICNWTVACNARWRVSTEKSVRISVRDQWDDNPSGPIASPPRAPPATRGRHRRCGR